ncbi:MAG: hypothetical protein ABF242_01100 [Flavobacteriales bacterium]
MKKNSTHTPQDIEDLLLNKSFEKLNSTEKEFALTQVENETEYKELRNTLLSVKQLASQQESVFVPNRIKADLMKLMEEKKKPIGWFSALSSFLFPSNTSLFRKPGLQLATFGLLLLFIINIGIDFTNQPQKEMAINTTKTTEKDDKSYSPEQVELKEPEKITVNKNGDQGTLPNVRAKEESQKIAVPAQPAESRENYYVEETISGDIAIADLMEETEDEIIEKPSLNYEPNQVKDQKKISALDEENEKIAPMKDKQIVRVEKKLNENAVTLSTASRADGEVIKNSQLKKYKEQKVILKSQSLKDNSAMIDLLFVTL